MTVMTPEEISKKVLQTNDPSELFQFIDDQLAAGLRWEDIPLHVRQRMFDTNPEDVGGNIDRVLAALAESGETQATLDAEAAGADSAVGPPQYDPNAGAADYEASLRNEQEAQKWAQKAEDSAVARYDRAMPGQPLGWEAAEEFSVVNDFDQRYDDRWNDNTMQDSGFRHLTPKITPTEANEWFYSLPSRELGELQLLMMQAGVYETDEIGMWDLEEKDFDAWAAIVGTATRIGISPMELLKQRASANLKNGGGGSGPSGPRKRDIQLTSPDDAKEMANAIAATSIGRSLSEEEISEIVASLHGTERQQQQSANAVRNVASGGGTLTQEADPRTVITQTIEKLRPVESRAHDTATAFQDFLGMIGG